MGDNTYYIIAMLILVIGNLWATLDYIKRK